MPTSHCLVDEACMIIITRYIQCPMRVLGAISILPLLYIHIRSFIKKKMKISKALFIATTIFYLSCFMAYTFSAVQNYFQCHNSALYILFRNIGSQFYVMETILLCGILYYRLYIIFRGTRNRLSKCTNITFWIFYLITAIGFVFAAYTLVNHTEIGTIITSVAFILVLLIIIYLDAAFICKLCKTMHSFNNDGDDGEDNSSFLIDTITKNFILALISTIFTIMFALMIAIQSFSDSIYIELLIGLLYHADILTDYVCVALTFKYFDGYYDKLCSCCHVKCHRLWNNCARHQKRGLNMSIQIQQQSNTVTSRQSPNAHVVDA